MDANEIATLVGELEDRVERLRALYDQYFMGIERLEPLILRKEVDRRIWQLRREPIRNTALRFKLQTVVQRYNTHQQHWQRICREIENGTYFRDVSRAAARFGEAALTAMGRKRQKMFEKGAALRAGRDSARAEAKPPSEQPEGEPTRRILRSTDGGGEPPPAQSPSGGPTGERATGLAPVVPLDPPLGLDLESLADLAPLAEQLIDRLDRPNQVEEEPSEPRHQSLSDLAPLAEQLIDELDRQHAKGDPFAGPQAPPPNAPTPPPVRRRSIVPPRPRPEPEDLTATRLRELYGAYVDARRRCHESTAGITFERLTANLKRTADVLRTKHPGRQVAFEVVIKNGSAVLKAIVKG